MLVGKKRPLLLSTVLLVSSLSVSARQLPGTTPLTLEGDLAAKMVLGIDRFLMGELEASIALRANRWKLDFSSRENYLRSVEPNRQHFLQRIGAVDSRLKPTQMELVATTSMSAVVGLGTKFSATAVRWTVLDGVQAEGLLLKPKGRAKARVVAIGDAGQSPESLAGLLSGLPVEAQFARRLAENGCEVLVPLLIDRDDTWSGNPRIRMTNQPHREYIYRMAFEMGRHIIGYEVQKVLAAVDYFEQQTAGSRLPIGVMGYGEGGLLALYSAAADPRIDAICVSGYFQSRQDVWQEPIYRNVWGLLDEFGDAEVAGLICPRPVVIEASRGPEVEGPSPVREGRSGAAPGRLTSPPFSSTRSEVDRARDRYLKLGRPDAIQLIGDGTGQPGSDPALRSFLSSLGPGEKLVAVSNQPDSMGSLDSAQRMRMQFEQLCEFTQKLVRQSEFRRAEFMRDLDTSSPDRWNESTRRYRDTFRDEIIGRFPPASLPLNPRVRKVYEEPKWDGYEVVLDVWPDVYAYGILLLPRDLQEGERRPVVVCQHGLEGRPQDVCDPKLKNVYHAYGGQLADRGFIVFAPQNPYIGKDNFRVLQRKANPLGKSLFSVIVRQHERILEWLKQLPFVDSQRIGFYGLSYGGKTAMRVPALLDGYALSICSGDFNEWIIKNTSVDHRYSYMFTGEYEMFEFNLGQTFNYAEMAALIAPRPFMVERGHRDAVAPDEWVAHEYAKVRRLYVSLGIPNNTDIEYFDGPHEINGRGTFEFLSKHLGWPTK